MPITLDGIMNSNVALDGSMISDVALDGVMKSDVYLAGILDGFIALNLRSFITVWKTDNAGVSSPNQIKLPLPNIVDGYDFDVDWGDDTSSVITAYDDAAITHTYPAAGTYTVTIDGVLKGWYFNYGGDRLKILTVEQWGTGPQYTQYDGAWRGCSNVVFNAADVPNLSAVTNFYAAWNNCSSLTSFPIMNTSKGTDFSFAWAACGKLASFPLLDVAEGINFDSAWGNCTSLTSFPLLNTAKGTNFSYAWYNCNKLVSFPTLNLGLATTLASAWRLCSSLTSFPLINIASCTNLSSTWLSCAAIAGFLATGMKVNFALPCNLDGPALDVVYENLTDLSAGATQTIDVTGNPGVGSDNPFIALLKNWAVVGSPIIYSLDFDSMQNSSYLVVI